MNSSINPMSKTRVLRETDSDVTVTLPDELDLSNFMTSGSERAVTPEMLESALESGYREGWDRGYSDAFNEAENAHALERAERQQQQQAQLASVLNALETAIDGFKNRQAIELNSLQDATVDVALKLAAALLGRELELAQSPGRDALARAMRLAPVGESLVVRLNPSDVETLGSVDDLLVGREFKMLADPSIESGDCLLDAKDCQIDARIEPAIERVRMALLGDTANARSDQVTGS